MSLCDTPSLVRGYSTLSQATDRLDGGWRGAEESGQCSEGTRLTSNHLRQAGSMGELVGLNAEGYEVRAERWMDRWQVSVRVRVRHDDDTSEWYDLLQYQTGHYDFTDPSAEAQTLMLNVARMLD